MSGGHNRFSLGIHGSADFHPPIPPVAPSFNPQLFLTQFLDRLGGDPEARLGKAVLDELAALSKENDPELFWEEALRLAHRLERQDRIEASLALLQGISAGVEGNYTELQRVADRRANVLLGQGEFGDRFEFMLRRVTHEVSDPWAIAAFGAGSLAFRAAKLGALSRLWAGSTRGYLPGRAAAELIASGAGLGAEA